MFGTLISVESESQLFNATKTLKLRGIDQLNDQTPLGGIAQRDDVVDRVEIDPLRQFLGLVIEELRQPQSNTAV